MKNGVSGFLAVVAALGAATAHAGINGGGTEAAAVVSTDQPTLRVTGPVEAYDAQHHTARILGQTVLVGRALLVVGDSVSVVGTTSTSGLIAATSIKDHGLYIAGASPIFISGQVQKVNSSVGTATVSGITVDLTPLMADSLVAPVVGSKVQVAGVQPALGGVVIAAGINGGGQNLTGINGGGTALTGINGGGTALTGINGGGTALTGINGGGTSQTGINGGGTALTGINGGGTALTGINGGGTALTGINGGGTTPTGINGGGTTLTGINGGGTTLTGINGGGTALTGINGGGTTLTGINGGGTN